MQGRSHYSQKNAEQIWMEGRSHSENELRELTDKAGRQLTWKECGWVGGGGGVSCSVEFEQKSPERVVSRSPEELKGFFLREEKMKSLTCRVEESPVLSQQCHWDHGPTVTERGWWFLEEQRGLDTPSLSHTYVPIGLFC